MNSTATRGKQQGTIYEKQQQDRVLTHLDRKATHPGPKIAPPCAWAKVFNAIPLGA